MHIRKSTTGRTASPLAAGAAVPLAFIGVGVAACPIGTVWLVVAPGTLALPHVHPTVVALAHAWLLGGLLTICSGAIYQLLPVLANTAFTGRRLAWTHLALHVAGVAAMVPAFMRADLRMVAAGGTLVGLGVGCLAAHVGRTLRAAPRRDAVLWSFAAATGWLVVTVSVGVLLAANLHWGWLGVDVLAVLRAHAHLGVAGFFVTLLQGALFRLVPMFALGEACDLRRVAWALGLSQAGLLLLAPSLGLNWAPGAVGAALLWAASAGVTAVELRRLWGTRRKRAMEPGLQGFFLGLGLLAVAVAGGGALAAGAGDWRTALAYGVLAILGGLLTSVQGMLCKIVPFLVWMSAYGPQVGRQPVPAAAALGWAAGERAWVWLQGAGVLGLTWGTTWADTRWLLGSGAVLAAGQGLLLASLARTARHLWRPLAGPGKPTL